MNMASSGSPATSKAGCPPSRDVPTGGSWQATLAAEELCRWISFALRRVRTERWHGAGWASPSSRGGNARHGDPGGAKDLTSLLVRGDGSAAEHPADDVERPGPVIGEELRRLFTWQERHRRLAARLIIAFGLTLIVFAVGSVLIWAFESGKKGGDIHGFGDAIFFTAVQLLTISSAKAQHSRLSCRMSSS